MSVGGKTVGKKWVVLKGISIDQQVGNTLGFSLPQNLRDAIDVSEWVMKRIKGLDKFIRISGEGFENDASELMIVIEARPKLDHSSARSGRSIVRNGRESRSLIIINLSFDQFLDFVWLLDTHGSVYGFLSSFLCVILLCIWVAFP